jgi:hypothetical protein
MITGEPCRRILTESLQDPKCAKEELGRDFSVYQKNATGELQMFRFLLNFLHLGIGDSLCISFHIMSAKTMR